MDCHARRQIRDSIQSTRRGPSKPVYLHVKYDSNGNLGSEIPHGPIELTVEPTGPDGMPAEWFDDIWWTEVVQRWGDDPVTIQIAPTPIAVLHPVVLHHVEMLRRVSPRWRIVSYAYVDDICTDDDIETFTGSLFHEVRFISDPRPGIETSDRFESMPLEQLFARIREAQTRRGTSSPILVRLPSGAGPKISSPAPPLIQEDNQPQARAS